VALELAVWRIDKTLVALQATGLDLESRLENLLDQDITIANPGWFIVGRQMDTGFGSRADLLAIDVVGNLVLLELKRDQTPRDVVTQALEYGSWVRKVQGPDLAQIYRSYIARYHADRSNESFEQAFCKRFGVRNVPEDLNQSHELVVVASQFDETSERIVNYLAEEHEVSINAIFFRVFQDEGREYLSRVWMRDPSELAAEEGGSAVKGEWNNEYYVSFGGNRDWEEARRYGFISGGGGAFYSRTLGMLSPGDRVWVNVPGSGYVGVGEATGRSAHIDDVRITTVDGLQVSPNVIEGLTLAKHEHAHDRGEDGEYVVPVKWVKTVPLAKAIKERGFFGNQNTVARPRAESWRHTVERLKQRFGIDE
jgi:hypothetical protein